MVDLEDGSNTIDIDLVPVFAFPPKKLEFYERIWSNIDTSEGGPHWLRGMVVRVVNFSSGGVKN